jgi:hypothetical protein
LNVSFVRYRTYKIVGMRNYARVPDLHDSVDAYGPVQGRVLQRALQKVGGMATLAAVLCVPVDALQHWLAGYEAPPNEVFLIAVDLITSKVNLADPYSRS